MRINTLLVGFTLALFPSFVSQVSADTRTTTCTLAGSFTTGVETNIDTNGDGFSGTLDQGVATCKDGTRAVFQNEVEWVLQPSVTSCPNQPGMAEFHISETAGQGRSVATDLKTTDQTFSKIVSGTLCVDTATGTFTGTTHSVYLGGTGKYAGVTGTSDGQTVGTYLVVGSKGGQFGAFGRFSSTAQTTINLPGNGKGKKD